MRIVVDVPDFRPGRTKSHAVASYVRALMTYQALRRDLAHPALEVARGKKTLAGRAQAETLMAEVQALCEELGVDADIAPTTDVPR
jgi:hypothetical protein